eukprot:RCo031537
MAADAPPVGTSLPLGAHIEHLLAEEDRARNVVAEEWQRQLCESVLPEDRRDLLGPVAEARKLRTQLLQESEARERSASDWDAWVVAVRESLGTAVAANRESLAACRHALDLSTTALEDGTVAEAQSQKCLEEHHSRLTALREACAVLSEQPLEELRHRWAKRAVGAPNEDTGRFLSYWDAEVKQRRQQALLWEQAELARQQERAKLEAQREQRE